MKSSEPIRASSKLGGKLDMMRMMRTIYKLLPTSRQACVRDYYSRVRRLHNLFVVRGRFVQYQQWKGEREVGALGHVPKLL
jgi:hypothetical protein